MIHLANPPIRRADSTANLRDQLVTVHVDVKSTEGKLVEARLNREVAELNVGEYEHGQFVVDKSTFEAARLLAKGDVQRKRDLLELAKDRLAKVRTQSKNAPDDAASETSAADIVAKQEIDMRRAELALASAESKVTNNEEFTKPKRLKELRSRVEKARAEELVQQASSDIAQVRFKALQATIKANEFSAAEKSSRDTQDRQTRESLVRAIAIEEQLEATLNQVKMNGGDDLRIRGEIKDLSQQLETILEQAEAEQAAAQFDAVKVRLRSSR